MCARARKTPPNDPGNTQNNDSLPDQDSNLDSPEVDLDDIENIDPENDADFEAALREFTATDEIGADVVLTLRRVAPTGSFKCPTTGLPISITGHLEDLPVLNDRETYKGYTANKWGGGTYIIQARKMDAGPPEKNSLFRAVLRYCKTPRHKTHTPRPVTQ